MTRFELITSKDYYETSIALRFWDLGMKRRKAEKLAKKLVNKKFMEGIDKLAAMVEGSERVAREFSAMVTERDKKIAELQKTFCCETYAITGFVHSHLCSKYKPQLEEIPIIGNMFKVTCEATNAKQ